MLSKVIAITFSGLLLSNILHTSPELISNIHDTRTPPLGSTDSSTLSGVSGANPTQKNRKLPNDKLSLRKTRDSGFIKSTRGANCTSATSGAESNANTSNSDIKEDTGYDQRETLFLYSLPNSANGLNFILIICKIEELKKYELLKDGNPYTLTYTVSNYKLYGFWLELTQEKLTELNKIALNSNEKFVTGQSNSLLNFFRNAKNYKAKKFLIKIKKFYAPANSQVSGQRKHSQIEETGPTEEVSINPKLPVNDGSNTALTTIKLIRYLDGDIFVQLEVAKALSEPRTKFGVFCKKDTDQFQLGMIVWETTRDTKSIGISLWGLFEGSREIREVIERNAKAVRTASISKLKKLLPFYKELDVEVNVK